MLLVNNIKLSLEGKLPADVSTLKNQFCVETGRWQEKRKPSLPIKLGFYYTHVVTFYEDDILSFLQRLSEYSIYLKGTLTRNILAFLSSSILNGYFFSVR
jgi:hypothetical protein